MTGAKVLIVDDEKAIRDGLQTEEFSVFTEMVHDRSVCRFQWCSAAEIGQGQIAHAVAHKNNVLHGKFLNKGFKGSRSRGFKGKMFDITLHSEDIPFFRFCNYFVRKI